MHKNMFIFDLKSISMHFEHNVDQDIYNVFDVFPQNIKLSPVSHQ